MTNNRDAAVTPISKALATDHAWSTNIVGALRATLQPVWKWLTRCGAGAWASGVPRRLRIAETVSFGEKRFVSILQVDGEQFLVGGSSSNISLLAKLESEQGATRDDLFESVYLRMDSEGVERHAGRNGSIEVAL